MSDLWRELPLFGRESVDESAVPSGWDAELEAVRAAADEALAAHPNPEAAAAFDAELLPRRGLFGRGRSRRSLADLDRAVYAYLELCAAIDATPRIPERASGAVALGRAARAPAEIRGVIAGCTIQATDAFWSFGRGPVLEGTAVELLEFLGGRSLKAPRSGTRRPVA